MKEIVKLILRTVYSYFYNGFAIFRMKHYGHGIFIGRGLEVEYPRGISIADRTRLGRNCRLACYPDENGVYGRIVIQPCWLGNNISILSSNEVLIKSGALLASNISMVSYNHGMNPEAGCPYGGQPLEGSPIIIGKKTWIGEGCIISSGVEIGDWSIVGAGSVVTKSIPPYSIAVGNPAKVIKKYSFEKHKWVNSLNNE